jgi:hypothetical protein
MSEFNLTKALNAIASRVTDEQREEQEKLNQAGRARLLANSMENRISLAKAQERSVLEQIDLLQTLPESFTKTVRLNNALDRLGELYAQQGKYANAIEVTPTVERRRQYQLILDAIDRPDTEVCDCPPETIINRKNNTNFKQPMMQRMTNIVSLKHGREVTLKVCRSCGDAQAN